jgi:hypothetical protein
MSPGCRRDAVAARGGLGEGRGCACSRCAPLCAVVPGCGAAGIGYHAEGGAWGWTCAHTIGVEMTDSRAELDEATTPCSAPPAGVIDRHTRDGQHRCRRCGQTWPRALTWSLLSKINAHLVGSAP